MNTQLAQLETALSSADAATKQLLGQSTSKWMNSADQSSPSQQRQGSNSNHSSNGYPAVATAAAPIRELPAVVGEAQTAAPGHILQHHQSSSYEAEQQTPGSKPESASELVQLRPDVASEQHLPTVQERALDSH